MSDQPEALRLADALRSDLATLRAQNYNTQSLLAGAEAERDALRAALSPFAALLQEHHACMPDNQPIFGINSATITVGQLRAARAALKEAK